MSRPPIARRARSVLSRLVLGVAVAAIVVAGIWLTGGKVTNDFTVAMWLTVGWIALAGLVCLGVAFKHRSLAWPVLGAYVVTAGIAGVYLGRSMFLDDEVNEKVVAAVAADRVPGESKSGRSPDSVNVLLGRGRFQPLAHEVRGVATLIERAEGGRVVTLTGFEVDNGPDLRIYLVAGPARDESEVEDFRDLGALKGNKGDQQYELPPDARSSTYSTVVIWCRAFSVAFARAPLERP